MKDQSNRNLAAHACIIMKTSKIKSMQRKVSEANEAYFTGDLAVGKDLGADAHGEDV